MKGKKVKWTGTVNVNARFEVEVLAGVVSFLESEGVILTTASDIVRSALKLFYLNLPEEFKVQKEEAVEILAKRGLVQKNSEERLREISMKLGSNSEPTDADRVAKEIGERITRDKAAKANENI